MGYQQIAAARRKQQNMSTDGIPVGAFTGSGAPTNNVTELGRAVVGAQYIDLASGTPYKCTATNGTTTITWAAV